MARKYQITINDIHIVVDEKSETTMSTFGSLEMSDNEYTITYKELDGELAGSTTKITVKDSNCVCLSRTGPFNTELILELEKRHNCYYETPYGSLMMGVYTHEVQSHMSTFGGILNFSYSLDFNGDYLSENELHITVKEIF